MPAPKDGRCGKPELQTPTRVEQNRIKLQEQELSVSFWVVVGCACRMYQSAVFTSFLGGDSLRKGITRIV
jgi:hypothetical protein